MSAALRTDCADAKPRPGATESAEGTSREDEPKTLIEALVRGKARLLKVRANGTRRSLPYLSSGSDARVQAEKVAEMRMGGHSFRAVADALNVSTATARRCISNLELARAVEDGVHDRRWAPGTQDVVVHVVEGDRA